jgi:LPXTG-motif cell wall-anchored protein
MLTILAILPEGSVRDETTFFILLGGLAALVGAAMYLRFRRKREENGK